jgi:hypothetical protein
VAYSREHYDALLSRVVRHFFSNLTVSHRDSVAILEELVGQKT